MITTAKQPRRRKMRLHRADLEAARVEALQLLNTEIDFVPNKVFGKRSSTAPSAGDVGPGDDPTKESAQAVRGMPAHLARLCETSLLTAEDERALFKAMNFAKFRANSLRSRLDPDRPDRDAMREIRQLLREARDVRNRIIRANMRLVVAVVKKFVTPHISFDDLLSDGILSLMQAVDKFDFDRGFRFSTYAYRAIVRNAYRTVSDRRRDALRASTGAPESVFEQGFDPEEGTGLDEHRWEALRSSLGALLNRLDRRERLIIRCRFALGSHRRVRTFQDIADRLGISKERVRQLEARAVAKLRSMASGTPLVEYCED